MASDFSNPAVPASNLGSLTQAARQKQLNQARGILLVIGILTVAVNVFFFTQADQLVDKAIQDEVQKLGQQGRIANQAEVAKVRDAAVRLTKMIQGGAVALGVLFIVFGLIVKKFPVPITIISLVLYLGAAAVFGFLDPTTLAQGFIVKIIIIVALVKSIQAAIAYQRETDRPASLGGLPPA